MDNIVKEMPPGYRFSPTDEELISLFLINKVKYKSREDDLIHDIEATELYRKHPKTLVSNQGEEREWYFFIHQDEKFRLDKGRKTIRIVGNGKGFWKSFRKEEPIYNSNGNVFAFKTYYAYFTGPPRMAKKTLWRMEEYCLPLTYNTKGNEWMLGKIKKGEDCSSTCF